jgi:hypothetical protein
MVAKTASLSGQKSLQNSAKVPRFSRLCNALMLSLSPLENAEYKATHGICWEIRGAQAKMRCVKRLSPLENHRYAACARNTRLNAAKSFRTMQIHENAVRAR